MTDAATLTARINAFLESTKDKRKDTYFKSRREIARNRIKLLAERPDDQKLIEDTVKLMADNEDFAADPESYKARK